MGPYSIHNDKEYRRALAEVERLWNASAGSEQAQRLETWGILIDQYERMAMQPLEADPVDVIRAEMAMSGRERTDLAKLIGQSRATEILGRKRALTLDMIRALSRAWDIPADLLIKPYGVGERAEGGARSYA